MDVENELKHKACNIDLFAKMAIEDIAALGEYSSLLLDLSNQISMEMKLLREQNKKLKEALKFYADESHYRKDCIDSRTGAVEEVIIDNGRIARNTLEECEL